jgi:hypothetical protein
MIVPDEGHWINKPQNAELWYKAVQDWLAAPEIVGCPVINGVDSEAQLVGARLSGEMG